MGLLANLSYYTGLMKRVCVTHSGLFYNWRCEPISTAFPSGQEGALDV
jgi:hypothetical protein